MSFKILKIIIGLLIIGGIFYYSPEEGYWLRDPMHGIEMGRTCSLYLFCSSKSALLQACIDPAKAQIEQTTFRELSLSDISEDLEKIHLDPKTLSIGKYGIIAPLYPEMEDMKLILLQSNRSLMVMTFAYEKHHKVVEIPGKGKILFTLGMRYIEVVDKRLFPKIIRKIANMPLIRGFTGTAGTAGRWVLFDYKYEIDRNEYLDWLLKDGNSVSQKHDEAVKNFQALIKDTKSYEKWINGLKEHAMEELDLAYEWGSKAIQKQYRFLENLQRHKVFLPDTP